MILKQINPVYREYLAAYGILNFRIFDYYCLLNCLL